MYDSNKTRSLCRISFCLHHNDVIMGAMASQITCLVTVYSAVYSGADQRKHQSSASLAFVREIHRGPVNSPHKWPVTRKMFQFDDVIMLFVVIYSIKPNIIVPDITYLIYIYHTHTQMASPEKKTHNFIHASMIITSWTTNIKVWRI